MPTVQPGSKVLVSGANGFIAMWVVRTLLEKGYAVRGTVRSQEKGQHLTDTFKKYGEKFELIVVQDITAEGAFDEAVKGIDAIEHTASPAHFNAIDPQEVIEPAVKGTVAILQSALRYGSSVKRIVVTSSTASIFRGSPHPRVFSEADWNEQSVKVVEEQGSSAGNEEKYRASKTLAEKAAWDFYNKHKSELTWDLAVLNPPFVFGPVIHNVSSLASLNSTTLLWADIVLREDAGGKSPEELATAGGAWIDVRDLGEAHVVALEKEAAGGERMIVCAGHFVWQDWIDVANSLFPSPIPSHTLPRGTPGAGINTIYKFMYNSTKSDKILGLKYRSKEELTRDTLADFEARAW